MQNLQASVSEKEREREELKTRAEAIAKQRRETEDELQHQQRQVEQTREMKEATERMIKEDQERIKAFEHRSTNTFYFMKKFLHNRMQEIKGNIRVFCRLRPLLPSDNVQDLAFQTGVESMINCNTFQTIEVQQPAAQKDKKGQNHFFRFDGVFGAQSSQEDIFREVAELVKSALDGYKVCIFAYGQTGSGKTFTMEGDIESSKESRKGMIPRSVRQIFDAIEEYKASGWNFKIIASFQEIYLEQIRDLLSPENSIQHFTQSVKYEPTFNEVRCFEDVFFLLKKAHENRVVAETFINERSSRSHSLFQLKIVGKNERLKSGNEIDGALNLIDLAGSERLRESKAEGERLKETLAINKSLSALGDVISALANKDKHVPYRNSKLTYLLQSHLGGESSKTLMIVNVSPLHAHLGETINSLRFAAKVNTCVINKNVQRENGAAGSGTGKDGKNGAV